MTDSIIPYYINDSTDTRFHLARITLSPMPWRPLALHSKPGRPPTTPRHDGPLSQQAETRTELAANAPEAGRLLRMEREAGVKMESPGRTQTPEERRLRERAVGKRKFEPEDLALFGLGAGLATILPSPAHGPYFSST